jgi:F0F1-type ATP synthase assembly protein I
MLKCLGVVSMEKKPQSWLHYAALGTGISGALAGLVIGGYFLGSFLDRKFDSYPLWSMVIILAAVAIGIVNICIVARRAAKTLNEKPNWEVNEEAFADEKDSDNWGSDDWGLDEKDDWGSGKSGSGGSKNER